MSFHALNLDELRSEEGGRTAKTPFEHQRSAFDALNKCFDFDADSGKGGLLVLPTGAGKTFTTVKWLCDNVLTRNIRVLWLANSYYLLDQAFGEILGYARWIPQSRQSLNVRLVSLGSDDVVVMTTPTAIKNLHCFAENLLGDKVTTNFRNNIPAVIHKGNVDFRRIPIMATRLFTNAIIHRAGEQAVQRSPSFMRPRM
jgi:superfamily II DNA or RNA helicase